MDSFTLKSVSDLPAPFRSVFSFRYFNSLQSECFPVCYHSNVNMIISAPTGSGKTVLFELCILRLLLRFISAEGRFVHIRGTLKTIYIAPSKALVQEKVRDWNQKFGSWGINCLELTGDNEVYNARNIHDADIILTTPEKFDAVSRYRIENGGLSFFSDIALLLIDEVHILNDPRGAALEAIVSRIKMLACNPEMKSSPLASVRLLAVSATIPNIEDLAEWLRVPVQGIKRFGEEMRPVKLTTKVFGYSAAKNDFLFEKRLQNYIFDILMQYSRGKAALVFCATRKGAQEAAQRLTQITMSFGYSNPFIKDREQQERLREASLLCSDKQMQSYILYGVGYHNGGLCLKDRNLIEGLFLKGDVQILCTTNTLAHGINLPAHTVVIKSTQHFNKEKGLYMEYDRSTILQMCGRAGRPPFDDTGMVIIMTRRETVHLYENLLNGCEMVESQLLSCVTEHLTAEIVQLTVSDITRAIEWMKCSYLYVRMQKNPENYAVRKEISRDRIEKHMQEICVQKVNELSQHQMIWTDEDGFLLKPLEPGKLMTKYYLKFNTMKNIMQTPINCSLEDALLVICQAEEISWIQLRRNEKKLLNEINIDKNGRLRFHINGDKGKRKIRIQTREEKIFVLVNDCLTGDPSVHDLSLTQDMNSTCANGCRIAKCMKEYFIYKKNYRGTVNSSSLAKSLHQKLWDDSPYLLKQLPGIGTVTAKALHSMGITSFEMLAEADPRRIEIVTGRKFPFGNHIKESLQSLPPKVDMQMEEIECQRQGKAKLVLTLTRLSQSLQSTRRHYADMIVGLEEDNLILFHEKIRVDEFASPYSTTVLVPNVQQRRLTVRADLVFEEYIGIDLQQNLLVMNKCNPSMNEILRKKQRSLVPPPEEVCVIEDDSELVSQALIKRRNGSMPSFKLLDEELGEGETSPEVENDDCVTVTEQTVFDHIREKAKKFPVLTTANNACSPSPKAFLLTMKRPYDKHLELHDELNDLDGDGGRFLQQAVNNSSSETIEAEQIEPVIRNSSSPMPNTNATFSGEEKIFDHIRKKAKNFPALSTLMTWDWESQYLNEGKEHDSKHLPDTHISDFDESKEISASEFLTDTIVNSDFGPSEPDRDAFGIKARTKAKENVVSGSYKETPRTSNLPPKVSRTNVDFSSMKILSYDISMMKSNTNLADSGRSVEDSRKQKSSPSASKRQCCSLTMASETRGEGPFLGFKSIFSFL
ncbi:DExH-box ATP-dependent RNA helicase DExH17 [Tripterygium wilfordii]|uniref:DExH-box ATP-dependent RNA helicase DExH17 n=1 Tax=Tripterygium wilfordii TaxID=458696 RepID=UPI0018F7F401|nr:DExH-box ATP-dependent RNA helicase DExH17 [Tripterygium wilfordii]XP_038703511.1 DExH-box ATP-dependent RNA helicase DExH17 [Tripterygium wilfordii]